MTRKRYIKLLMGCQGFSRNDARALANKAKKYNERAFWENHMWKLAGEDKIRKIPLSYKRRNDLWGAKKEQADK
jgi:hypothetical protein